jgi:hypothetical protein
MPILLVSQLFCRQANDSETTVPRSVVILILDDHRIPTHISAVEQHPGNWAIPEITVPE